ncbi:death effector domain-containing protein [Patagioenas fasciata monilis]|uniref:Death effector domain-containing protein n=1 Tax=Patagioenas fasciata monilis TaxID=372326 RepID=A0A1V4JHA7_PATFA|nr:death effector domain-containing protein [Patagioenas fasciata monilis]
MSTNLTLEVRPDPGLQELLQELLFKEPRRKGVGDAEKRASEPPRDAWDCGSESSGAPGPGSLNPEAAAMAAPKRRRAQAWPEERGDREHGLYSLHRMFDVVGAQLTHRDVRVLSFLFVDVIDEAERGAIRSGRDFLLALERQGRCDETNLRQVLQLLRIITRHDLLPYVTLKRRRPVCPDLVDKYLEETSIRYVTPRAHGAAGGHGLGHPHKPVPPQHPVVCCSPAGPQLCAKRPGRGRTLPGSQRKRRKSATPDPKEKQTCGEHPWGGFGENPPLSPQVLLRARAIETQCYVVAAAQTGQNHERRVSYGHSLVADPWGTVVAQCSDTPGLCYATIDLEYLQSIRRQIPVHQHRRHDLYGTTTPPSMH